MFQTKVAMNGDGGKQETMRQEEETNQCVATQLRFCVTTDGKHGKAVREEDSKGMFSLNAARSLS